MRTIDGWQRVDVIYRRIDDLLPGSGGLPARLDPRRARTDARLARRQCGAGQCPGAGVADDKLVYTFVPAMIRYYLDQDAILPNVPSFLCATSVSSRARAGQSGDAGGQAGQ